MQVCWVFGLKVMQLPSIQEYFLAVVLDFIFLFSLKILFVGFDTKKGAWQSSPGINNIFALLIMMLFLLQRLFSVMAPTQRVLLQYQILEGTGYVLDLIEVNGKTLPGLLWPGILSQNHMMVWV